MVANNLNGVSDCGSPPSPTGRDIHISGVGVWPWRASRTVVARKEDQSVVAGKRCEPGRNFSSVRVVIEQTGNAFFCLRWERERTRRETQDSGAEEPWRGG